MRRFTCDEARAQLADALAGEISRPDANVLEAHLLECDPCRSLTELFLWQDRVLVELAGQARLDALMSKVRSGLENLDQVTFAEEALARRTWEFSRKWAVAAAAAFILVLVAVVSGRSRPAETITPPPPLVTANNSSAPAPAETQEASSGAPEPKPESPAPEPQTAPELPAPVPPAPLPEAPKPAPHPAPALRPDPPAVVVKAPEAHPGVARRPDVVQPAAPEPRPRTLDEAVRGGMAYLRARSAGFLKESKTEELLLWTYLQGGVPEGDPEFQALLKSVLEKKLDRTYNVAFTAMVLEELDRLKYQRRIAQCAQYLLDNQCANGQWSYGDPSIFAEDLVLPPPSPKSKVLRRVTLVRKRDGQAVGDNSNSMYAMLGLRACHDAGIVLPRETINLAAKWWRESQTRSSMLKPPAVAPEGWCYGRHDHRPYGSMTVGGVGSLVICDYILGSDWKRDPQVASGMEWLGKNFSVSYNPGPFEHAGMEENSQHQYYYYMYGLERAAILYGTDQIGGHFWFAQGLQVLLDSQRPDGSWKAAASGNELNDTCFAVLFLRKATRALLDVPTPGGAPRK